MQHRRLGIDPNPGDLLAMTEATLTGAGAASRSSMRTTALIVASAMFMEQLDGTVLATALPTMAQSFGTAPLRMNVALTSYLLTLAMFIPASGKLADRYGSRTVFRAAIGLFTTGSILCGLAQNLPFLVAARMLQGMGGALMSPVGRLVLIRACSKSQLVSAMAWLMIPATVGPILGPPLGGFIVTYLSWRWIFFINVPIGLLGIVLVTAFIDEMREPVKTPFDAIGLALSGSALACLMFGIEMGSRGAGSRAIAGALIAGGIVTGLLYWWHARRTTHPILDFRLMRIATFRFSVISGSFSRVGAGATPFLLPMMLQLGFGYSAAQSGLVTFAGSVGSLLMRLVAPALIRRLGFRNVMTWIGFLATFQLAACAGLRPGWPRIAMYVLLISFGFFQSLMFMAYNTIAYADVPRRDMSGATSLYSTIQQMALSLGIAVSASVLAASVAMAGRTQATNADFSAAYLVVAAIALAAPAISSRLDRQAGAELSGRTRGSV
ncbi:MAG TPA: DHA2 family efflux MFS transporter permease subunit, partial [Acetobacteraceae bacterium]|nr:DHA2 family efflux MFS transporter permease subunit [Acetobacteraceae bacterium]